MKLNIFQVFRISTLVVEQLLKNDVVAEVQTATATSSALGKKVSLDEAREIVHAAFDDIEEFLEKLAQILAS